MIKILLNSFKISFDNVILATPLLLFIFLLNTYLAVAKSAVTVISSAILFYVTLFLMISAFLAGWFNMIKIAVTCHKDSKKGNDVFYLLKEFPVGIAEYLKSYMGFVILYLILGNIFVMSIYYIGMHFIGNIGISMTQIIGASETPAAMRELINSLTNSQLIKIQYWYLLMLVSIQIFSLFTIFWPVEIIYSTKNSLIAFFKSILLIFKKPQIILVFIYINILNFILLIFNYFAMFNSITYLIMTLVFFTFIVYVFVLLFLYYEEKIKSNSNSGTDSNRQEQTCS